MSDWEYRVFSERDDMPDDPNSGLRRLHIRKVWFRRHSFFGMSVCDKPIYPIYEDVFAIAGQPAVPEGNTIADLLADIDAMQKAADKPALILAEWTDYIEVPASVPSEGSPSSDSDVDS